MYLLKKLCLNILQPCHLLFKLLLHGRLQLYYSGILSIFCLLNVEFFQQAVLFISIICPLCIQKPENIVERS
jgi:hypothetical protein